MFYAPTPEPLDCKIFSPMQPELASSSAYFPASNNRQQNSVPMQYGTNESENVITQFMNSVLNNPDEMEAFFSRDLLDPDCKASDEVKVRSNEFVHQDNGYFFLFTHVEQSLCSLRWKFRH